MKRQEILDILGVEPNTYSKKQLDFIVKEYKYLDTAYKDEIKGDYYICFISDYGVYFGGKKLKELNWLCMCEKALQKVRFER